MDINNLGSFSNNNVESKSTVSNVPNANQSQKSDVASSSSNGNIVDRIEISSSKQQVQTKDIVTGDPYIVSDKVVTLFTVNGEQYTRFRSLETGDVVYFPDSYQNYSTLIKQDNLISNNINKEI